MEISKKHLITFIALTAIISFSIGYSAHQTILYVHRPPKAKDNVYFFIEKAEGSYGVSSGNVITNIGENETRNRFSQNCSASDDGLFWPSIGNATASASLTQLTTEYRRELGTMVQWQNGTDFSLNITRMFTFNETQRVDCAGLQWDGTFNSNNNLYACADFSAVTFNNMDNLTVTWSIRYDAN